jgi:molybdate transport system substrate-binding protein
MTFTRSASMRRVLLFAFLCLVWPAVSFAAPVRVAVASNFAGAMNRIVVEFARSSRDEVSVVTGATGTLAGQIENGAPFDLLLAADEKTPVRLESEKLTVPGTRFTYAFGSLVVWSAGADVVDPAGAVLRQGRFRHLAIANPKLAPYGAAAFEAIDALGLRDALASKIVQGENIAQAFDFVATGNAEIGFVALSQVVDPAHPARGSYWVVPPKLYSPIRQDAVLLARAEGNPTARALWQYLKESRTRAIIQSYGYGLDVRVQ